MGTRLRNCDKVFININTPHECYNEYQEPPTYMISAQEMSHFLRGEIILQALMTAGVHQWEGFEAAIQDAKATLAAQEELE